MTDETIAALKDTIVDLGVALEQVIALHGIIWLRPNHPDRHAAWCRGCKESRDGGKPCSTLRVIHDALNLADGDQGHVPAVAQSDQVRRGDAATIQGPSKSEGFQRFEDWVRAYPFRAYPSGQVPDSQRPRLEERDAGVRPSQAGDPTSGGPSHLPPSSGVGPEQDGRSGDQAGGRLH